MALVEKPDLYELLAGKEVVLVLTNGERWSGKLLVGKKDKYNLALLREKGMLVINRNHVIYARLRREEIEKQKKKKKESKNKENKKGDSSDSGKKAGK